MTEQSRGRWNRQFWMADLYGLVRIGRTDTELCHPEVWRDGKWVPGFACVMDAITGMGEDAWSCVEYAEPLWLAEAKAYAAKNGVDLFAESAKDK